MIVFGVIKRITHIIDLRDASLTFFNIFTMAKYAYYLNNKLCYEIVEIMWT